MKKILILNDAQLYLTHSWGTINHGICGHTFELIEYWYILKDHIKTKILICDDLTLDEIKIAVNDKYNFNEQELSELFNSIRFENRPILIKGDKLLIVDGGTNEISNIGLLFNKIFFFSCGNKDIYGTNKPNRYVLEDFRVYPDSKHLNKINYKKKILFNKLKEKKKSNKILLYLTQNCRLVDKEIILKYLEKDKEYILLTDSDYYDELKSSNVFILRTPMEDMFNISKYIYTPISRKWDCSPRFIAECKFFNIDVEYFNIDYLDIDLGLKYRKFDISNNFKSLSLESNDDIIKIIKE